MLLMPLARFALPDSSVFILRLFWVWLIAAHRCILLTRTPLSNLSGVTPRKCLRGFAVLPGAAHHQWWMDIRIIEYKMLALPCLKVGQACGAKIQRFVGNEAELFPHGLLLSCSPASFISSWVSPGSPSSPSPLLKNPSCRFHFLITCLIHMVYTWETYLVTYLFIIL